MTQAKRDLGKTAFGVGHQSKQGFWHKYQDLTTKAKSLQTWQNTRIQHEVDVATEEVDEATEDGDKYILVPAARFNGQLTG